MSSERPKSHLLSERPEAGLHVWPRLQWVLEKERWGLRQLREKSGLPAALAEQEERLRGLDDPALMEQMFCEAQLRYPNAAPLIERVRASYYSLLAPLMPEEEERVRELEYLRKRLLDALWNLQRQVQESLQNKATPIITLDLQSAHEVLRNYQNISGASPRILRLVQEIKIILNDLDQIAKQLPE